MATAGLLKDNRRPPDEQIYKGLEGNLCRCTGYINIVKAVKMSAKLMRHKAR
jgi:carbon-monoxide dehydrogenase small subunit